MAQLFGFEIKRKSDRDDKKIQTFVTPTNDDGAVDIAATGGAQASFIDLEGSAKSEAELVQKYRDMAQHPEVLAAIDDIVNEAIVSDFNTQPVEVVPDDIDHPASIKNKIIEEFNNILTLLDFNNQGYDVFSKWYVDGRIHYHVMINEADPSKGIVELRYIDPRKLRKVREFKNEKVANQETGVNDNIIKKVKNEYYIYNEKGFNNTNQSLQGSGISQGLKGLKIAKDSIVSANSGVLNEKNTLILSHLHKAYKPLNQLRMMEDAAVIYRISRAPERRIFYIDVGNLPKMKAEQYLRDMMTKHKNRLVYNASTGEVKDDRRHMSMTDDFWLPRREGGRGTEITTLPGGQNLGELDDILYFQKKLYRALNVPVSRMDQETGFSLGRSSEITRDEIKFSKFVARLRNRFSILFDQLLEKQLILKGIITVEEWNDIKENLRYDFSVDNHFEELKQSEVLQNRLQLLRDIDEYTGKYYSIEWIRKNVLQMTDDDIKELEAKIKEEEPEEDDMEDNVPEEQ